VSAVRSASIYAASNTTFRLGLVAVVTVIVVVACDKVPLTSPTGSTISLSIDRNILPLNGQATVRAVVTESAGTPVHNGTVVTFQPSIGRTDPVEAQTVNGIATVTFLAGQASGTGFIHAFSGSARTGSGNISSGGVEVRIGSAAAGSIALQVVPPSVGQNGGSVSVTAQVIDSSGNALPGVPVLFSTDVGTLSNATVLSDANGFATTNLATTRAATVTARAGTATATFNVGVNAAPTVTITASTATPTAGQPVSFTITPSAAANASPIQSVTVDFGNGQVQSLGAITGPVQVTQTYNTPGGYTISATATDINGGRGTSSTSVVVQPATLPTIGTFTATPNPVPPSANGLTTITVSASSTGSPLRNVTVRNMTSGGEVIYSGTGGGTFSHRFGGTGTYTLQASATDAGGNTGTSTTVVVVQ
jgi:hypothetical protein